LGSQKRWSDGRKNLIARKGTNKQKREKSKRGVIIDIRHKVTAGGKGKKWG